MKMFRMIVVRMGLLLLVFHSFYAISYASSDLTRAEKAYIEKKGQIVFVSQSQYAPFEFIQKDGNRDGMCIELARWIATEFGFKARFIDTSFATAQQMIQDGKADVLTSFFYSKKRDQLFDFSQTMFYIPATIFVAADRPDIKNMQDLNGKIIAIQKGDYAEDFLHEKQIDFTVLHANNFSEATDMVIQGKADAIIGDEQIVLYHLYSNNLEKKLKKVGKPLYTGENSMAVVEKNRVLTSILNKGIDLAQERGVLKTINEKWLGTKLQQQQNIYYPYRWHIGITSLSILCLLVAIWLWNLSLRREVRRRTMTLRENEHFLDTVIEHIPNMIFVKKAEDLTFLKFNRAGEKLTGYSLEKLYGKNDDDFFPKEQADFFTRKDREVLNSRELVDIPE
ncbi:MAG: transporter substrate-binding domain-containing protein, partial [Thermodesulfobacteriota bacterium]|nr:transporter substrate-binding domain-containing protein [Thermodesulfobacteriota bacterium]